MSREDEELTSKYQYGIGISIVHVDYHETRTVNFDVHREFCSILG